nr:NB-ARC domains-containing protein [Tanacetum cinerariifolium]
MSIGCGCSLDIRPEHHINKTMYTSNRQPSCDHIFAPTVIVNNTSSNVVGSRGSSGQRVSSRRQCIHPSGSTSSCRIDQQPSFVKAALSLLVMAASSISHGWKYDVFVSFRGEDIRKNFMDHLFNDFKQKGIHTFRDDNELPKGEEISPHLYKAIEESRFLIVIFFKNYASSSWCLRELVKILECKQIENPKHEIRIIFYDAKPDVVRKQKVSNSAEVTKWKDALSMAADLSGFDLQDMTNGYESKFIDCISKDILIKLCDGPLKQQDVTQAQMQVIYDIMKTRELKISNVGQGIMVIKKMMSSKRILLVLDDVDHRDQLKALAGLASWFCPGSLIIFTCKDKQLLRSHRVVEIHDMDFLNKDQSLQLFSSYAFEDKCPSTGFEELADKAMNYVQDTNMRVLLDKSLITISSDMSLQMHDLIQAMAREIVREEFIMSGRQSRLLISSNVYGISGQNKVARNEAVEVLVLSVEKFSQTVHIDANDFEHMKKLRILKIYQEEKVSEQKHELKGHNVIFSGNLYYLSNELSLFYWHGCPFC